MSKSVYSFKSMLARLLSSSSRLPLQKGQLQLSLGLCTVNVALLHKPDSITDIQYKLQKPVYKCCAITIAHRHQQNSSRICVIARLLILMKRELACRLEGVLYSLTSCSKELLLLRQPAVADLQFTCAWASQACSKSSAAKLPKHGKEYIQEEENHV